MIVSTRAYINKLIELKELARKIENGAKEYQEIRVEVKGIETEIEGRLSIIKCRESDDVLVDDIKLYVKNLEKMITENLQRRLDELIMECGLRFLGMK